jgi:hypothetical protein
LGQVAAGSMTTGMELLTKALDEGLTLSWIDAVELPEDTFTCTAFSSGSISAGRPESESDIF